MFRQEAEEKYRKTMQRLTAEERLRIVFELHEIGRELVRAGIRSLHPDWKDHQIEAAVKDRIYANPTRHPAVYDRPT